MFDSSRKTQIYDLLDNSQIQMRVPTIGLGSLALWAFHTPRHETIKLNADLRTTSDDILISSYSASKQMTNIMKVQEGPKLRKFASR